jgi:hypothetical protein
VAVGCLLREIRSRKGTSETIATDPYIGGPRGSVGPNSSGSVGARGAQIAMGVGVGPSWLVWGGGLAASVAIGCDSAVDLEAGTSVVDWNHSQWHNRVGGGARGLNYN